MNDRRVHFHVFCSVKGGVGKSTLAVAMAKLLAARGRVPVLIDVDLTGSSLADGLALCAPKMTECVDGSMDLDAPPTGAFLSHAETVNKRHARKLWMLEEPPAPPYLNDALLYQVRVPHRDCRVDAMLWSHERPDGVLYLPSSPLRKDVEDSSMLLHGNEHFKWVRRAAWVLEALLSLRKDITDVVLDMPPGMVGFTHQIIGYLDMLAAGEALTEDFPDLTVPGILASVQIFLLTTPDWNALLPTLEDVASAAMYYPALHLRPIVNRTNFTALSDIQRALRQRELDPALRDLGLEEKLEAVDEGSTLGEIFRRRDLVMTSKEAARLENILLKEER
ncbi:MAG: P-loop NTPase [Polyangiaceae bacterium]|nr:P-loop NTPase [Polyangiaceae bacterium]